MDTLFRLVSFHQPQAAAAPYPSPDQQLQQQSPYSSRSSRSTTSTGSPSSTSHHIHNHYYSHSHSNYNNNNNSNYYYYPAVGSGGEGCYYLEQQQQHLVAAYQEECCNDHRIYMDEGFSSSSSSRQHVHSSSAQQPTHTQPPSSSSSPPVPTPTPPPSTSSTGGHGGLFEAADFSFPSVDIDLDFSSTPASPSAATAGTTWATQLLLECARAVAARDSQRVQQLMWMLNELASPYGDVDQKLASYFLQGLFARLTSSGPRTLRTLAAASDRNTSFESTRRTALRFQELSPWASFGHVAANGSILESFLAAAAASSSSEQQRLHILDLSNTFCTQWPTLLEALATRSSDETPHLSITTVVPAGAQRVMPEIAQRLEKFARLMGVPFAFRVVHHAGDLAALDLGALLVQDDDNLNTTAALAVNCVNALRGVAPAGRDAFLASVRRLDPRVVTVVEEEADLFVASMDSTTDSEEDAFVKVFGEGLRFFTSYMDSLEESFPKTSNEKLALERAAGRAIVDLVSCPASESAERRETGSSWARRMRSAGFSPVTFSDDVADDMRSLLRRYREGWSSREPGGDDDAAAAAGVFLAWKEQPVVWTSAWRA